MKKCCSFIVFLLIAIANSYSQNYIPHYNDFSSSISYSSPNVAAFQKYGDIPVDITTGSQQISIPFTTLKLGSFFWPLSISYHSNGVKVADMASDVGLGWALNAYGVISEKTVGLSDIQSPNIIDSMNRYLNMNTDPGPTTGCYFYNDYEGETGLTIASAGTNGASDVFYFNDPLHAIKFFLKYNDSGYAMPANPMKIKFNRNSYNLNAQSFTALDENGNTYNFTINGFTSTTTLCTNASTKFTPTGFTYYLTSIITNQGQRIDFSYSDAAYGYPEPKDEVQYVPSYQTGCTVCSTHRPLDYTCTSNAGSHEKRLDTIKCSTGEFVLFKYSSRTDLANGYKLDSVINGYNLTGSNVTVKKWALIYDYFNAGNSDTTFLRLQLTKVRKLSADTLYSENYSFDYDPTALPGRLSFAVDSFGFYNGQNANTTFITTAANRTPNASYVSAGSLKKITYPTGGYTLFEYGLNPVVGGNQVQRVKDYDNLGNVSNDKRYEYKSSIAATVQFYDFFSSWATNNNPSQGTSGCGGATYSVCNGAGTYLYGYECAYYRYRSSPARQRAYDSYAALAKYDTVFEYFGNTGENGYKKYELAYPDNFNLSYTGIGNKVVKTYTYRFNASTSDYSLVNTKSDNYSIIDNITTDPRVNYTLSAFIEQTREQVNTTCNSFQGMCVPALFLQTNMTLYSTPVYKNSTVNIDYTYSGGSVDSITTSENFYYASQKQYNPIKISSVNSKGEEYDVHKIYAVDIVNAGAHDAAYDSLIRANRLGEEIIDSVVKVTGIAIARGRTNYAQWANGLTLTANFQNAFKGNALETQTTINAYDSKGNIVQYTGKDNIVNTTLYGYNYNFPIAKIKGADYNTVMSQLTALGATNDIRYAALQTITNDSTLRATLVGLRGVTNSLASVYTYAPFVGTSSETDPGGKTTYYEYDSFNRLSIVRDNDKNIIKKFCYNYAGQIENCDPVVTPTCSCPVGPLHNMYKCIGGICEAGIRVNTSSTQLGHGRWDCTYHYEWSDGSWSIDYTDQTTGDCTQEVGGV